MSITHLWQGLVSRARNARWRTDVGSASGGRDVNVGDCWCSATHLFPPKGKKVRAGALPLRGHKATLHYSALCFLNTRAQEMGVHRLRSMGSLYFAFCPGPIDNWPRNKIWKKDTPYYKAKMWCAFTLVLKAEKRVLCRLI